jgi:prepilin-type N-terminal cleavage/methylation domain-containing protein
MKRSVWNKFKSGFSLIEVLIAIFLIGVAFVGIVAFFNSTLQSHFDAKNELIAAGLAQEGSELMRNLRDYKSLEGSSWSDLTDSVSGLPICERIDYKSLESHGCYVSSTMGEDVCFNSEGRYEQCDSGDTGFTRSISVTCEDEDNNSIACSSSAKSMKIVSTVVWGNRTTEATDRLYENEY